MCVRVNVICEFLRTAVDYAVKLFLKELWVCKGSPLLSVIFCFKSGNAESFMKNNDFIVLLSLRSIRVGCIDALKRTRIPL